MFTLQVCVCLHTFSGCISDAIVTITDADAVTNQEEARRRQGHLQNGRLWICTFDSLTIWRNYYDPHKTFLCALLTAAMAKIVVLVLTYALIGNFENFEKQCFGGTAGLYKKNETSRLHQS